MDSRQDICRVLLVEDDPTYAQMIQQFLEEGENTFPEFQVTVENKLQGALHRLSQEHFHIILLDPFLSEVKSTETCIRLKAEFPALPIVLLVDSAEESVGLESLREGAQDYLLKESLSAASVRRVLHHALERKRSEDTLKENKERMKLALKSARVGTWSWDVVKNEVLWDEFMYPLYGLCSQDKVSTFEQVLGMMHPEDREAVIQSTNKSLSSGVDNESEYRVVWPDGSIHFQAGRGRVLRDEKGNPLRMTGVCWEITQQRMAEEAMKRSEEKYRVLYEDNPSMYFTVEPSGKLLSVNHFGAQVLGYEASELEKKSYFDLIHQDDLEKVSDRLGECVAHLQEIFSWEARKIKKNGELLWVKESARGIREKGGEVVVLIVSEDISDRKRLDRIKSNFINIIYHELKAPLDTIFDTVHDLKEGSMGELHHMQIKLLEIVHRNVHRLVRVTDNLHELSKLELGITELNYRREDLSAILNDVMDSLQDLVRDWKIDLSWDIPEGLPPVQVDWQLISKVFQNLIINALKLSKRKVRVKAGLVEGPKEITGSYGNSDPVEIRIPLPEGKKFIQVSVENDAAGIVLEDIKRLLREFLQGKEEPMEGEIKKSRLDLAICKEIMLLHKGMCWAETIPGTGTVFHCLIPL